MALLIRATLLLTAAFLALVIAWFVVKIVFVLAVVAAVVAAGYFGVHFVRGFGRRIRTRGSRIRMLRG